MSTRRTTSRATGAASVLTLVALAALLARIGADARWPAALGDGLTWHNLLAPGVSFAAAPSAHWPNVLVLAELILGRVESLLEDRGLMLAGLSAAGAGLALLARDARAGGANTPGTAAALLVAGVGALPALAIARLQMFSLVMFPLLVALLRAQSRRGSRHIWLAVPLLAVWSNLHGAAILGLAVLLAYLMLERGRRQPVTALAVAAAAALALCVTPALSRTPAYYEGVVTNVAAQRGQGMWGPLSLTVPLDVVLVLAAAVLMLAVAGRRVRMRPWEWAVACLLAVATLGASRNGVWLLFFLVAPAARAHCGSGCQWMEGLARPVLAVALTAVGFALARGPIGPSISRPLLTRALALAHGTPVLASAEIGEQVALDGGRIWIGNPLDAFSRHDQGVWLDWLEGTRRGRRALVPQVRVVLVEAGSAEARLMARSPGFSLAARDRAALVYTRTRAVPGAGLRASR